MPAPHRVLRDSELAATRLVAAARASAWRSIRARRANRRVAAATRENHRRRRRDDGARGAGRVAARARRTRGTIGRRAYEAFRTQTNARDGARASIGTQFDEVNARLRAELDLISTRRDGDGRAREPDGRGGARAGGRDRARARGTTREGANSAANRRRDASDGDDSARSRDSATRAAVLLICDINSCDDVTSMISIRARRDATRVVPAIAREFRRTLKV